MTDKALDDDGKDTFQSLMRKGKASLKVLRRYAGEEVAITQGVELEKSESADDQ